MVDHVDDPSAFGTALVPNDPLYEQYQWNLRQIQIPDTWDLTIGSPDIIIAILDTGISLSHPDLANKLVPGYDFVNNDDTPDDDHGNGTHVAGIAAAETNNGVGIAGVAWQARLMPVKVLDANAGGDPSLVALGVRWAVDHGARVLNLGLAGPTPSVALQDAIEYARRRGVVVVAPVASGGNSEPSYPAAIPGVIAVAATDRSDQRLAISNTGDYISVAAPGEQIASTFRFSGGSAGYAVASSTGPAAAHVSGLAALLLSINPALQPDEVRTVIEAAADDVGRPGYDSETGAGRINVARTVLYAAPWNFNARGAGSYTAALTPANRVNFPLIMKDANGWNTSFTVQNTTAGQANLAIDLYDEEGRLAHSFSGALPAQGAITYEPARIPGLHSRFVGAAIVRSDAALSGVVNEDRAGRDRLTYEGFTAGADTVWIPLLMRQYHGWSTGIQIQNLGTAPSAVRVTYTTRSAAEPLAASTISIAPFASRTLYQPVDDRIPTDWVGSAIIESLGGQPLAAIVNQVNSEGPAMSYVGVSRPTSPIFAPLLFKNANGWNTGLQVQNASSRAAIIEASFAENGSGAATPRVETASVAPGASATFYQPANRQLPDGFVGAGVVASDSGQALGGVVNEVRSRSTMATAYDVIDRGADTLYVPLLYRGFAGWNSGLQIQNVGASTTTTTVTFYGQNGAVAATVQGAIEPDESATYYLPSIAALRSGFIGSAIVTSSGEPIAAIVNHVK